MRQPAYTGNDQANLATVNGENDYAANFIPDIEKTFVAKDPANNGYWFPSVGATVMLYLNTTKKPFDDVNVRKAISMAIDRDQIATVAEYGYTKPADVTGLSDAYPNYKVADTSTLGDDWTKLNVDKANQMLDAAGLKKGADGMRTLADGTALTYDINVVNGWSDWVSACQIIAQGMKAIGINATVKPYDFSTWYDRVSKGQLRHVHRLEFGRRDSVQLLSRTDVPAFFQALSANQPARTGSATSARPATTCSPSSPLSRTLLKRRMSLPSFSRPSLTKRPLYRSSLAQSWYEYNNTRFTGSPTKDNPTLWVPGSTRAHPSS